MNISKIPWRNAVQDPDKIVLIYEDQRISAKELNGRINRLANAFIDFGLRKGDKVAILTENVPAIVEANYACAKAGIIYFPVMSRLFPKDIGYLLDHSDSSILMYHRDFLSMVEHMKPELGKVRKYIQIEGDVPDWASAYEDFIGRGDDREPGVAVDPDDTYCFLCTGGTTGISKLAMMTHFNALTAIHTTMNAFAMSSNDIGLQVLPLFHVIQNNCLHPLMAAGATVVLQHRFDALKFMKTIHDEKVNIVTVVPPFLFSWIMAVPEAIAYDISHVRSFATAAATFPDDLKRDVLKFMPKARLLYSYGLTESSGGNATVLSHENMYRKSGSIGLINPMLRYRIIDSDGKDVPAGEPGELLLKGPAIVKGYYKQDEETAATFVNGWLRTGDIVRSDEDGFIYFVDRLKDMIKTGGENVFAKEVEDVILMHPQVLEVAVFGFPDPQWGEKIHAAVVLKPGQTVFEEDILGFCKASLAGFKSPKRVIFLAALPRNPSGKILKHVLKKDYEESLRGK